MTGLPKPDPKHLPTPLVSEDLSSEAKVATFLARLLTRTRAGDPVSALLPWVCDRLPSEHSRKAYGRDLAAFVRHMEARGTEPLEVTGDDLRVYKAALLSAGQTPAT